MLAQVAPGDVKGALPAAPPHAPESLDDIIADFERVIVPGVTHWNHPGFHAYFSVSASMPGILGELLAAGDQPVEVALVGEEVAGVAGQGGPQENAAGGGGDDDPPVVAEFDVFDFHGGFLSF